MSKYVCELCKKVFPQKIDLTRHRQKKAPCISVEAIQELTHSVEVKRDTKKTLVDTFKQCENILRDTEALTGDKALRNWTYLLILKMMEQHIGKTIDLDNYDYHIEDDPDNIHRNKLLHGARFTNLVARDTESLDVFLKFLWDDILSVHPSTKNIFLRGKGFDIQRPSTYRKLIDKLNALDLAHADNDVLGDAYEEAIQSVMRGKVLGQFFTQPMAKKLMIKLIDPRVFADGTIETCCDPTMGTGGFLISYLKDVMKKASLQNIELNWDFVQREGLYGREIESDTFQMAVSNMMISSGHMFGHLEHGDSIRKPINRKFDTILANPPFGIKGLKYDEFGSPIKDAYVPIRTDNAVSLFLQAIIYMLKHNGRCAVVLPDGQDLFSKTNATLIAVREYLLKTCDLKEIIYLPPDSFTNTSIKTCVFYFVKKREGTEVLEITKKMSKTHRETGRSYKFSKTHQTSHVNFYDYNPYEEIKRLLVEVPIERIAGNSYSLNYSEYLEEDKEEEQLADGVVMKTLGEVCSIDCGTRIVKKDNVEGEYPVYGSGRAMFSTNKFNRDGFNVLVGRFALSHECVRFVYGKMFLNDSGLSVKPNSDNVLHEYIGHYLACNQHDVYNCARGTAQKNLDIDRFKSIQIPVPPLERQREIVDYLDFVYEQCVKTSRDKIEQLKRLNAMCLTNQMQFGENVVKTLGEVCTFKNGKGIKKDTLVEGAFPVIGGGQKPLGYHNEYNTPGNTILCSSSGAYAGFISKYSSPVWASDCFSITPRDMLDNTFLYHYLKTVQNDIHKLQTGSAQPHVNSKNVQSIQIPIPSLERQREIVDYCEANDALIASLEAEIERNKQQANQFLAMMVQGKTLENDIQETIGEESANAIEEEQEPEQEENI